MRFKEALKFRLTSFTSVNQCLKLLNLILNPVQITIDREVSASDLPLVSATVVEESLQIPDRLHCWAHTISPIPIGNKEAEIREFGKDALTIVTNSTINRTERRLEFRQALYEHHTF